MCIPSLEGVPDFEREVEYTKAEIQVHRAHLAAASNLRYGPTGVIVTLGVCGVIVTLCWCRGSLSTLGASLEQSIEQLEVELEPHRDTPLSVKGRGGGSTVPWLLVPEVAIPVSGCVGRAVPSLALGIQCLVGGLGLQCLMGITAPSPGIHTVSSGWSSPWECCGVLCAESWIGTPASLSLEEP